MRHLQTTAILIAALFAACGEQETDQPGAGEPSVDIEKGVEDVTKKAGEAAGEAVGEAEKAAAGATKAADEMMEKAKTMLADAMAAIKDGKIDDAKGLLGKLDGMKASLPEGLQSQIADAWKALKAKEAVGGLKFPK